MCEATAPYFPASATEFDESTVSAMGGQFVDVPTLFAELESQSYIDELKNVDVQNEVLGGNSKEWTGSLALFNKVALGLRSVVLRRQRVVTLAECQDVLVAYELLQFAGFDFDTFDYLMRPLFEFNLRGTGASATPAIALQCRGSIIKLLVLGDCSIAVGTTAEPQVFAEAVAAAAVNYLDQGPIEQVTYVIRVRGSEVRFYRASFPGSYGGALFRKTVRAPQGKVTVERFPPLVGGPLGGTMAASRGLDLLIFDQRDLALRTLCTIRQALAST